MLGTLSSVYNPNAVAIKGGTIQVLSRFEMAPGAGQTANDYSLLLRPSGAQTGGALILGRTSGDGSSELTNVPLVLQGSDGASGKTGSMMTPFIRLKPQVNNSGRPIMAVATAGDTPLFVVMGLNGWTGIGLGATAPASQFVVGTGRSLFGTNVDDGVSRVQISGAATISTSLSVGTTLAVGTNATVGGTSTVTGAINANGGINMATGQTLKVNGVQVVTARQAAIAAPAGGLTQDAESRAAINSIRAALTAHGLTS